MNTKVFAAVAVWVAALMFAPGTASADCAKPSDPCSPAEIQYLEILQRYGIDVSGDNAANDLEIGQAQCEQLNAGAKVYDLGQKLWASQSGKITQDQAMIIVGTAHILCPRKAG
jgi:hypothetical protein